MAHGQPFHNYVHRDWYQRVRLERDEALRERDELRVEVAKLRAELDRRIDAETPHCLSCGVLLAAGVPRCGGDDHCALCCPYAPEVHP